GNLSFWNQSKVPPSTMIPPIELPWPPMYVVAEGTTMSAPCAVGRHRYGDGMVLSRISGMPAACAISAIASRSPITPAGLDALSTKIALVRLRIAFWNSLGLVGSTKRTRQSNLGKVSLNWVIEPPYSLAEATISSPGSIKIGRAHV